MYAVVDIETTGGSAHYGKITEVAIFIHDGLQVIDEFTSLVNPECTIPEYITRLTGITNDMVAGAPRFFEIAKKIVEITEGRVFVAHNATFDYNFIRSEFRRLGYSYERDTLCTVKASRKIIPGMTSYSLGKLCDQLGIKLENRHRAGGDALATVRLLETLRMQAKSPVLQELVAKKVLPGKINDYLDREVLASLPETVGVYYLFDQEGTCLYIGKSKNIQHRVTQHLSNPTSKKARELLRRVASVTCECTGSELVALLRESEEIKMHQPVYNRAQMRNSFRYGIFAELRLDGFIHFSYGKTKGREPLVACSTEDEVRKLLHRATKKHQLCLQKSGLEPNSAYERACFHQAIQLCRGACIGKESPDDYNARAAEAMRTFQYPHPNFLIVDQGREQEEISVIKIENGRYGGYGYCATDEGIQDMEVLKSCTRAGKDNREVARIIQGYLAKKSGIKLIKY